MAISRTAKGTTTSKTSGTTLTISNVTIASGSGLYVGTGALSDGVPVITFGDFELKEYDRSVSAGAAGAFLFYKKRVFNPITADIVITWPSTLIARAAFATEFNGVNKRDIAINAKQASTSSPSVGPSATLADPNELAVAVMVSAGPVEDTAGTPGGGFSSGQRDGTTGGAATSNITIHELYKITTVTDALTASKTGATARAWLNVLGTSYGDTALSVGVTPSDLSKVERKFLSLSKDPGTAVFIFNEDNDRYEVYESSDLATLIAHEENGWI